MNLNLTDGSATTFTAVTPGQYKATFTTHGVTWELPVIGFAIILRSCTEGEGCDTEIDPVVLAEGRAITIYELLEGSAGVEYKLELA